MIFMVTLNLGDVEILAFPFKTRMEDVHLKFAVFHVQSFKQSTLMNFHYYFNGVIFLVSKVSPI